MAEKEKVSRSQAIRDYLRTAKPSDRGPRAVSESLKAKGINVTPQLVSQVKSAISKKKSKTKRTNKASAAKIGKKNWAGWDTWILARNLLKSVDGDLVEAKKNLEIISKLLS